MIARMLASDLRRTAATSTVLASLVALAALLAAMGGTVLAQLTGSLDALFERARTPDIVQMHLGEVDRTAIDAWAAAHPEIAATQVVQTLPIPVEGFAIAGRSEADSVLQPALVGQNEDFDFLLGLDGEIISLSPGEIALPVYYALERGTEVGDEVTASFGGETLAFEVVGFLRDSTMNASFVSSKRLLVNAEDLGRIAPLVDEPEYLIEFLLHDRGDTARLSDAYGETGPATNGVRMERSLFYLAGALSHGVAIAVLVLLAFLLVAVALISMRFAFLTAIERDRREIGVMKAIGLPAGRVRRLYLVKYAALAVVGAAAGLLLAVPVSRGLTASLRAQLGDAPSSLLTALAPTTGALSVALLTVALAAGMIRRLNRITAMDALREGIGGAGGRRARTVLATTRLTPPVRMGLVDATRGARTHTLLLTVLALCTFLMVLPLNVFTTFSSPSFVTYLGTGVADLRLELRTPQAVTAAPAVASALANDPDVERFTHLVAVRYEVATAEGEWEDLVVESGDHCAFPLSYLDGEAPDSPGEVALSSLAADGAGASVGGTVTLRGTGGGVELTVTGVYQDLMNGGRTAKALLPGEGERVVWHTMIATVADGADPLAVGNRIAAAHPGVQSIPMSEYVQQTLGEVNGLLGMLAWVAAAVAVALAFLIAVLFARMVIARDTSQIAIQRSLGIPDAAIRTQYLTRFLAVLLAGVLLGTLLVATLGQALVSGVVGRTLGAPAIGFEVSPLLAYVAFPLLLALAVTAAVVLATRTFRSTTITDLTED